MWDNERLQYLRDWCSELCTATRLYIDETNYVDNANDFLALYKDRDRRIWWNTELCSLAVSIIVCLRKSGKYMSLEEEKEMSKKEVRDCLDDWFSNEPIGRRLYLRKDNKIPFISHFALFAEPAHLMLLYFVHYSQQVDSAPDF